MKQNCNFSKFDYIPTTEINIDIKNTELELGEYQEELVVLGFKPENKTRVYMLEGRIAQRKEFIETLSWILEYREDLELGNKNNG